MTRKEFTPKTKREALKRARGRCEAKGVKYGMDAMTSCHERLGNGFAFDHFEECRENKNGGDNSLENCRVVCPRCHQIKTNRTRAECAKSDRIAGRKPPKRSKWKWKTRPMPGTKASGIRKRMSGKVEKR